LHIQISELECALSNKRNRIHELDEQVKRADMEVTREQELASQLRRQMDELKQARETCGQGRQEQR